MRCSECNGQLYGCPYEDYDIQECDEGKALTRMTELAYGKGREDAMQYILDRGQSLLESGKLTSEMVMGICLIMGIAKAQMKGVNG